MPSLHASALTMPLRRCCASGFCKVSTKSVRARKIACSIEFSPTQGPRRARLVGGWRTQFWAFTLGKGSHWHSYSYSSGIGLLRGVFEVRLGSARDPWCCSFLAILYSRTWKFFISRPLNLYSIYYNPVYIHVNRSSSLSDPGAHSMP